MIEIGLNYRDVNIFDVLFYVYVIKNVYFFTYCVFTVKINIYYTRKICVCKQIYLQLRKYMCEYVYIYVIMKHTMFTMPKSTKI
jgi:hypothetical protein